ncbi:MAG: hypothetical protein WA419_00020 [Silvibacterium sp.]
MTRSFLQGIFAPVRKLLPKWLSDPIRNVGTAVLTPAIYSYRTGHFRSSLKRAAVSKNGEPIPWYTYPIIDFLSDRDFKNKNILEFGGGQSTLWWAKRARRVVTFEGKREWHDRIRAGMPANVELHHVSMEDSKACACEVAEILSMKAYSQYDVIVIDGLPRREMIEISCRVRAADGVIICDNAEGYEFYERFKDRGLSRVDFYGNAPGVVLPHCTSIYFGSSSFVFDPGIPICVPNND